MNNTVAVNINLMKKKSSWHTVRISDVCEIDPSKRELNGIDKSMEVSFAMMADLPEHKRYFSPIEIKKISEVTKGGYSYFRENDVLLAKMTPCFENGKSGIALNLKNGIGFGSTEFYVLRSNGKVVADWIYFIISSEKFLEEGKHSLIGTTGRRRLIKHYVESFKIPLPPLEEQNCIVSLFQTIETAIEQTEQQEKNLRALQKSLSNGLVSEEPVFGNLLNRKNCTPTNFGGVADCIEQHDKQKKDVNRFIGLENIEPENLKITTWGNIADGTTFTKRFSKGDVLFGKRRAYLKKVAVADFDGICSGDILVLRANEKKILPELLPFYVSVDAFIQHAVSTSAGSLSPRTKWRDLSSFEISIPDLKTQEKIVEVFQHIQTILEQIKTQKQTLKNLKQKLLNEILG
ncbi:MAG: restriction endonuclease subunit S [Nitrospirae bacterium]|nr:restriction endonuclease subunit S [Nitrospirota bacterium]MCL5978717.1 restriction endonuclease subunit S [Nitrospirota bacterium]